MKENEKVLQVLQSDESFKDWYVLSDLCVKNNYEVSRVNRYYSFIKIDDNNFIDIICDNVYGVSMIKEFKTKEVEDKEYTKRQKAITSIEKLKDHAKGFINYKDYQRINNITKDIEEYIQELENMKGGK